MRSWIKLAALALPLISMSAMQAHAQIKLKISSATVNDGIHEWVKAFTAGVDQRAGGKIKIEFYPSNQLGSIPATVEGTALGTIEMVSVATGFFVGLEPRFIVFDAPGLFDNFDLSSKIFADPTVRARIDQLGKTKGVEPIAYFASTPLYLLSHKPVRTIADFTGQKIRTPGGATLHLEPYRRLGASPLSMPLGEVLPAMQNKTIDGLIAGLSIFTIFKYYDVAKALTAIPSSTIVTPVVANSAFLKSLGPDLEKIVREEASKAEAAVLTWAKQDLTNSANVWKKNGGEMIDLSPADQAKYLEVVGGVLPQVFAATPGSKEDYDVLLAASNRLRGK
ncbi:MAG: hypothetical protein BGP04_07160 [Rhizobiales bacterium 62-17]|nr:TRAP transporter substrate-binding protein [Hyphomicrobiales bacterium]OJY05190.1 MAG: hypothetical protein BGP04_07160 [Rhizobiales bacterium 62-17]